MTLLIVLTLLLSNQINAQDTSFNGKSYPKISVENILIWLNMNRQSWQSKMQTYDFDKEIYSEGSPKFLLYLNSNFSKVLSLSKKYDTVEIRLANVSDEPNETLLLDLFNQLEPYYVSDYEGSSIFNFTFENNKYQFFVSNLERADLIIVKKL